MSTMPAIIIARGGSRRLPRKNLMKICDRPLVEWSVLQLRNSHRVSGVWVSTDDDEVADIAFRAGAEIIREKPNNDADRPHGGHAMLAAMETLLGDWGLRFDAFLSVLPTAVVWKPNDFDRAIELFGQLKGCHELAPKYNVRECYTGKIIGPQLVRRCQFAKHFEYAVNGEQWAITTVDFYRRYVIEMPRTDRGLDTLLDSGKAPEWLMTFHYYPVEWYQQFDIDDYGDFCLHEILLKNYILNAYGSDCYERYGAEMAREVVK
jgi:hypothetical protein